MPTIYKIGTSETIPEMKNIIEASDLPLSIDYVLMTDGQCFVSTQYANKIGGQNRD